MSRSLSWSEQLDVLLNATDGKVAQIKQRLYPLGVSTSGGDLAGSWIASHHFPPQAGAQAQKPWALQPPTVPERMNWVEAYNPSFLWDEITILRLQLRSQTQVTEALRQAVRDLLEEQKQQMYKISALEASLRLLQEGPEGRGLHLEQRLEGLRRELQSLRSQMQEQAQAHIQMQTRPRKCIQTEQQLLWKESETLREELKFLRDQLSQHQELLQKQITEGRQAQAYRWKALRHCPCPHEGSRCVEEANCGEGVSSWRGRGLVLPGPMVWQMLEKLQSGQEGKDHALEAARTEVQDAWQEHHLRTSIDVFQSKLLLATSSPKSPPSVSSEVSLPDSNNSRELLRKHRGGIQGSTLSILEQRSSELHDQSLKQDDLFFQGPRLLLSDL